jgi:hypothetical protein
MNPRNTGTFKFFEHERLALINGELFYREQIDTFGTELLLFDTPTEYVAVVKNRATPEQARRIYTISKHKLRHGNPRRFLWWSWTQKPADYLRSTLLTNEWNHGRAEACHAIAAREKSPELADAFAHYYS